jgi:hypothetical protein
VQPIDIDNAFTYHPPTGPAQVETYQDIRTAGRQLAHVVDEMVPDGPEKTLAIRKIQEAVMWANAGIACAPPPAPEPEPYAAGAFGSGVLPCGATEITNDTGAAEPTTPN